jgi:hypothetical protein
MRHPTWVRPLGAVLAAALCLAAPATRAGASEGKMTWAVHVSLAPTWFDSGEHPGTTRPPASPPSSAARSTSPIRCAARSPKS